MAWAVTTFAGANDDTSEAFGVNVDVNAGDAVIVAHSQINGGTIYAITINSTLATTVVSTIHTRGGSTYSMGISYLFPDTTGSLSVGKPAEGGARDRVLAAIVVSGLDSSDPLSGSSIKHSTDASTATITADINSTAGDFVFSAVQTGNLTGAFSTGSTFTIAGTQVHDSTLNKLGLGYSDGVSTVHIWNYADNTSHGIVGIMSMNVSAPPPAGAGLPFQSILMG